MRHAYHVTTMDVSVSSVKLKCTCSGLFTLNAHLWLRKEATQKEGRKERKGAMREKEINTFWIRMLFVFLLVWNLMAALLAARLTKALKATQRQSKWVSANTYKKNRWNKQVDISQLVVGKPEQKQTKHTKKNEQNNKQSCRIFFKL